MLEGEIGIEPLNPGEVSNVDVIMICLNDGPTIAQSLASLKRNHPRRIIVVDGGSTDNTQDLIRSQGIEPVIVPAGVRRQILKANSQVQSGKVFLAEADQVFPDGILACLEGELTRLNVDGIQPTKVYRRDANWFERSHGRFLEVHRRSPGMTDFINGPQMWKSHVWQEVTGATLGNEGYSFDTELSERVRELKLRVAISASETEEIGQITFRRFIKRVRNYGYGDYTFFSHYAAIWSTKRKLRSLTHIFRRYAVDYPLTALLSHRMPFNFVLYLWLLGGLRYIFWGFRAAYEGWNSMSRSQSTGHAGDNEKVTS